MLRIRSDVMLLYHGSKEIVSTPIYGLGSHKNDYGRGFYCTEEIELAKEWATPIARDGFANKYELDETNLKILNLDGDGYHILNWMALLLKNRIFTKRSLISKQGSAYIFRPFLFPFIQFLLPHPIRHNERMWQNFGKQGLKSCNKPKF